MNAEFLTCLAKFGAYQATYKALDGQDADLDGEFSSIMEDSVYSPFRNLADAVKDLGPAAAKSIVDAVDLDISVASFVKKFLSPISSVVESTLGMLPSDVKDKVKAYMDQNTLVGDLLDPNGMVAILIMSAIKGVSTIGQQRAALDALEKQVNSVVNRIWDTPEYDPPQHPFKEVLEHLETAKNNFLSVSSQLARVAVIDYTRYNTGVDELKEARSVIEDGKFGDKFANRMINDAGLGGLVQVTRNDTGQVKLETAPGLKAYHFLPPAHLGLNVLVIKKLRDQIGVYNASITNVDEFIRYVVENLYLAIDVGRFLSTLVQFLVIEARDMQRKLDAAASRDVKAYAGGTIQAQAEVWLQLQMDIYLADALKTAFSVFNRNNVNDIPALKAFRKKLAAMDTSGCTQAFVVLDRNINAFVSAYNRRLAGKVSVAAIKSAADRLKGSITLQKQYLDCFEEALNSIGLSNIPAGVMKAIGAIGGALAFLQANNIDVTKLPELWKNFSMKAVLVSQMKEQISCMKQNCPGLGVQSVLDGLMSDLLVYERRFNNSYSLALRFSRQAKFESKYNGSALSDAIANFIDAVNKLTC